MPLAVGAIALGSTGLAAATESAPTVFVTVHLAADVHAVTRLAGTPGLTPEARAQQMRTTVARPAVRREVGRFLATRGFSVRQSAPFVIRAEAPRSTVDAVFPRDATGRRSSGRLADAASYVVSSDDGAGLLRRFALASVTGGDVRQLYAAPTGEPPAGHVSPAIATLQFSGWDSADLSTFALRNGLPDPRANNHYTEVSVDGADPSVPDGAGGEYEVALDQEALLTSAPNAAQIAYFAPNSVGSMVDAIEQVATDAYNGKNIGALSISYGLCETDMPGFAIDAMHQALADAVAMGVTVFAASGDSGAFGCDTTDLAVSYPASDPLVVAVGGTSVDLSSVPPTETVWWDGQYGSGGGTSAAFSEPAYQTAAAPGLPGRGVPDIALAGDPDSGLVIVVDGLTGSIGGTSLASPLAAGTFVDLLASNGTDYGVGDIHRNLYASAATGFRDVTTGDNGHYAAGPGYDLASGLGAPQWSAMRGALLGAPTLKTPRYSTSRTVGVKVGTPTGMVYNGWSIGVGSPPANCGKPTSTTKPTSVRAPSDGVAPIYVVGFTAGGYCYTSQAVTQVDTVAPVADAYATTLRAHRRTAVFVWAGEDHSPSSGLHSFRVRIYKKGSTRSVYRASSTTRQHFKLRHAIRRATYVVRVSVRDMAGNRGGVTSTKVRIP